MAAPGVYLPWASDCASLPVANELLTCSFVSVTVQIYGKEGARSRTLLVPTKMTCSDFKGHLAVNGVVSTCSGLEVALEQSGETLDDSTQLELADGQTLHLRRCTEMVSVTALVTGGGSAEDEVYELVVPAEVTGASLCEHIKEATAGALVPAAIFVAEDESEARGLGEDEQIHLVDDQALYVQRATAPTVSQPSAAAAPAAVAPKAPSSGLMSSLFSRLRGSKSSKGADAPQGFRVRCASNVRVKGGKVACSTKTPWASCAVFDVADPAFFEICVQLLGDAPSPDADGLAGRWMLGVVPTTVAATKTEGERRALLEGGYFVTVCHGHPAKLHVPSMPRGTCGEDFDAVPGELRAGQSLTLRWAQACPGKESGILTVQIDDGEPVAIPYSPPPFEEVRPCLVFGNKPAEVRVMQLEAALQPKIGGA